MRYTTPIAHRSVSHRPVPGRWLMLCLLPTALLSIGCATTNLSPISVRGADFRPEPDEVELWAETRAEEEELLRGFPIYHDPILQNYLDRLVERLAPSGLLSNPELDLHVTVLDDPAPYAFAFPHGTILVNTGLLDRTVNEDQLAAVLAREIAHVEGRHMARRQRAQWNKQVAITTLAFTAAILLTLEEVEEWEEGDWEDAELAAEASNDVLFAGHELAKRVTAEGYGDKLEVEADESAVRLLRRRGYDPRQAVAFYESLRDHPGEFLPVYAEGEALRDRIRSLRRQIKESRPPASPVRVVHPPLLDDVGFDLVVRPVSYRSASR